MKISVILPVIINHNWQKVLTENCIKQLKQTTTLPFQLIVTETGSKHFKHDNGHWLYIHNSGIRSYCLDFNEAMEQAEGDIIVQMANDIIVTDGWLEALIKPFDMFDDCGAATVLPQESQMPVRNAIEESVCFPIMYGFLKKYKFDHVTFPDNVSEQDHILQIYSDGKKMYRNFGNMYYHLIRATFDGMRSQKQQAKEGAEATQRLINKWYPRMGHSWVLKALTNGWVF